MKGGDRNQFGKFITTLREQQKVPLDRLCSGLCSISMITRIGNGERMPGKPLQDRLPSRLGVAPDAYENFLLLEDLVRAVKDKETQDALFAEYGISKRAVRHPKN